MTEPSARSVAASTRPLARALTVLPAGAVILANVVGTGVFVKARVMTANVGSPGMVLLVWLAAGLLTLSGALVYAELGTLVARSGGDFQFLGAAYGRFWAFLQGWTRSVSLGAGTAAVAILTVTFLNDQCGGALPGWSLRVLPVVVILVAMLLNLASVRSTGRIATALTAVKVLLVLGVGLGAFLLADGDLAHFELDAAGAAAAGVPESARGGAAGFGAALLGALWAYDGWAVIVGLGGELHEPGRTLPRAMIGASGIVIALYLLTNAAYFWVLTPAEIAALPESVSVAATAVQRFAGPTLAALLSGGLMISAFGTLHTALLSGARLPFALARRGLLPAPLGLVSARSVPAVSVLALGGWSVLLTLSGTFDLLTDIYVFVQWIFVGLAASTVFVLRRRMPDAPRPFRVPGYPVVPLVFLAATGWLLVNTLVATPWRAVSGLALVLAGLPVYAHYARRLGPDVREAWIGEE